MSLTVPTFTYDDVKVTHQVDSYKGCPVARGEFKFYTRHFYAENQETKEDAEEYVRRVVDDAIYGPLRAHITERRPAIMKCIKEGADFLLVKSFLDELLKIASIPVERE